MSVKKEGDSIPVEYIYRWRLEKVHPQAPVSNVIAPIVYQIDTSVPRQWVPWVKHGIEMWSPVLESAGFRNALVVREEAVDTSHVNRSARRVCTVVWNSAQNYVGGSTSFDIDKETGEILACEIFLNSKSVERLQRLAFISVGVADPHVRYPMTDSATGTWLLAIVTHEVGHSLGLLHNFKAGSVYPTDSLRSRDFARRMGHTASIMSYAYVNAIAQPEDSIAPELLWQRIGPYDRWAIAWGYRAIPNANRPEDELPVLLQWTAVQDTASYLGTSNPEFGEPVVYSMTRVFVGDPGDRMYAFGNDAIKSASYSINNLAKIAPLIAMQVADTSLSSPSTSIAESLPSRQPIAQPPQSELQRSLWEELLNTWLEKLNYVGELVGGATPTVVFIKDSQRVVATPLDMARQIKALRFVVRHAFYGDDSLIVSFARMGVLTKMPDPSRVFVFEDLAPGWPAAPFYQTQIISLVRLLNEQRISRLVTQSAGQSVSNHHRQSRLLFEFCSEIRSLDSALQRADERDTQNTPAQQHRHRLQQILVPVLKAPDGACVG